MKFIHQRCYSNNLLRLPHRNFINAALSIYILVVYVTGLFCITSDGFLPPVGVVLLVHSLLLQAYLLHDCTHRSGLTSSRWNDRLGQVLSFVLGSGYVPFSVIRTKHMEHHILKRDVVSVNYIHWFEQHKLSRYIVNILERIGLPAIEYWFHGRFIWVSLTQGDYFQRYRAFLYGVSRLLFFTFLYVTFAPSVLFYGLAYTFMIIVLRLMDLPQHSYETVFAPDNNKELEVNDSRDASYEQQHTFSNPLGRSPWSNFLVLNFGFHNAHHARPTSPWFMLGHRVDHYASAYISWRHTLKLYWNSRSLKNGGGTDKNNSGSSSVFIGSHGLSFLII